MLVDSHAHLDYYEGPELDQVLGNARAAGLGTILSIGIGDGPETMHRAHDLATTRSTPELQIFASAGIHPQEAHKATPEGLEKLSALAAQEKVIAIGEIGLDYYHLDNPDIATQKAAFSAQMKIAAAAGKPIILHCRTSELAVPAAKERYGAADAADDMLTMLEDEWAPTGLPGILHCFSGTVEHAKRGLAIGFYLSFAGNLTYPRFTTIREAAVAAPADRILVETDSPFLAPIPHRGQRNEPANTAVTANFLAELRGITTPALIAQTTTNFQRLFPTTRIPSLAE
ncbi:TatD family hydrolase [Terriglobus saanensis]|uniref:Hydrolase, TatD family n=1 Tax=Terriglobus saanensis (strain ATCC BAA-1853 / DSM 23119 / SP1PR4) TaxID=401053 RepID=E8UZZ5_TERSS|nr:TatD family hydrolase [Terriglobus saanensis]ADV82150.1 hydrolase, TatD family [Terriglobus saanensis SP1PR4]